MKKIILGIIMSGALWGTSESAWAEAISTGAERNALIARGTIIVEVTGFRNDHGTMRMNLYDNRDGFPTQPAKAVMHQSGGIKDGRAQSRFIDVPAGIYAVAVIHDENNNDKLDTNFIGIPSEGVGVSNNAKGIFGPPSFDNAKFKFDGHEIKLEIKIIYL